MKYKCKAGIIFVACVLMIWVRPVSVSAEKAYTVTPQITEAVYRYLDEIYIQKYPAMGLEFMYGTGADKKVLETLANQVTAESQTEEQKAYAIASWVKRNIEYNTSVSAFPVDVFYTRKGDCEGYAELMRCLMRLSNIPAVMCSGVRGDMVNVVDTSEISQYWGHAWIMAYYGGTWHLFDPLFDIYDSTDQDFIAKWYFTNDMEGIAPYYSGMDLMLMMNGNAIYYMDGRFMNYAHGQLASQYYGTSAPGGHATAAFVSYFAWCRHVDQYGGGDGYTYRENPQRRENMINDECYTDGWINFGDTAGNDILFGYARPNGILAANTFRSYGGQLFFLGYSGVPLKVSGGEDDYTLTNGYITIKPGQTIYLEPMMMQYVLEHGGFYRWESQTPEIAVISDTGMITGVSEGLATLVGTVEYPDSAVAGLGGADTIQVYVSNGLDRVADYSDKGIKEENDSNENEKDKEQEETQKTVRLNFAANGGKLKKKSKEIKAGTKAGRLPECIKKGYTFTGWYTHKTRGKRVTESTVIRADTKLYAHWLKGKLPAASIKKSRVGSGKIVVKLNKAAGANGYQIRYSEKPNMEQAVVRNLKGNTSVTLKKLRKQTIYYIQVRAYRLDTSKDKVYGKWSKKRKIKTKK